MAWVIHAAILSAWALSKECWNKKFLAFMCVL